MNVTKTVHSWQYMASDHYIRVKGKEVWRGKWRCGGGGEDNVLKGYAQNEEEKEKPGVLWQKGT
jgi:hypothetical protein